MNKLAAHVHAGRLVLDIPTELPEGAEIELSQADDWDALDDADRLRLRAALKAARLEVEAGDVVSAEEVLAELDAMLV